MSADPGGVSVSFDVYKVIGMMGTGLSGGFVAPALIGLLVCSPIPPDAPIWLALALAVMSALCIMTGVFGLAVVPALIARSTRRTVRLTAKAVTIVTERFGSVVDRRVYPLETLRSVGVGGNGVFPTLVLTDDTGPTEWLLGTRKDAEEVAAWLDGHRVQVEQLEATEVVPLDLARLSRAAVRERA